MFVDESMEAVEFKSSWKKERSLVNTAAQTREILTDEAAIQSIIKNHVETQTEEEPETDFRLAEITDPSGLDNFLQKAYPMISKALEKNIKSHAFAGYEVDWSEDMSTVTCLHTLTHADLNEQYNVTGISWNSTGSVIAAAYGKFDHEDWCTHKSTLCTWNLDRRNVNSTKPDIVIDTSSCLMCIAFHPQHPAWVAAGTFNGEVVLYDIGKEDETLVATSGIGDDSHREPVSKVQWNLDADSKGKRYNVISVSSDGKILVWQLNIQQPALKLINGFILLTESLPRSLRTRNARGDQEMGVTCLSFTNEDKDVFLLGSESGGIFKCSIDSRGTPAGRNVVSSVPLHSPVTFTFTPHNGPVYSAECSPFHRNVFLSCGLDSSLRLGSMLQAQAVITLEPGAGYLYSAKWSPIRPLVLGVTTEDGHLLIYDLKQSQVAPVQKLEASSKKAPVYTMQFNPNQRQLLATGDAAGYINIWQLSDELTSQGSNEVETLAGLVVYTSSETKEKDNDEEDDNSESDSL